MTTRASPPPAPTPSREAVRDQAVELWSTKVAPVVTPVVTSLRGAMARGPAYDYDGPEDTAAVPLANWPGRDADPNGWHARRRSYAQAERPQVRKRRQKVFCSHIHIHFKKKMKKKASVGKGLSRSHSLSLCFYFDNDASVGE